MSPPVDTALDPLIEGYLSYLDKIGRKSPRTIVDVRCTIRKVIAGLERIRPGVDLWRLSLRIFFIGSKRSVSLGARTVVWRSI